MRGRSMDAARGTGRDVSGQLRELGLTQDQVARLRAEMEGSLKTAGQRPSVLGAGGSGRQGDELDAALEACLADLAALMRGSRA